MKVKTADCVQFRENPVEGVAIAIPPTFRSCLPNQLSERGRGVERNSM
jgi:hypothetical protein